MFVRCLRYESFLLLYQFHRVEIVSHYPGKRQMRCHWDYVGEEDRRLAPGIDAHQLSIEVVAWNPEDAHARDYLSIAIDQFQQTALDERLPVLRQVACPVA